MTLPRRVLVIVNLAAALALAGCGDGAAGGPGTIDTEMMVRTGTGADTAALAPTVQRFRADLGPAFEEIVWEGVPDAQSTPAAMPADFFKLAKGAFFTTPGGAPTVSNTVDLSFSNLNPSYLAELHAFSPAKIFSPVGNNLLDVSFFKPGGGGPATVTSFGAVFVDVDDASASTIQFFDDADRAIGDPIAAPAFDHGLSFVGATLSIGQAARRVRLTLGNTAIGVTDGSAVGYYGATADVAAIDNLVFSVPAVAAAACAPASPAVSIAPASQDGLAGAALTYTLTVQDADPAACGTATFDLAAAVPAGFAASVAPSSLALAAGASATATLTVTSPAAASAGAATIAVQATSAADPTLTGSAQAAYNVVTATQPCTRAAPLVTLSPSAQSGRAGTALGYQLSVQDQDSATCAAATFDLAAAVPAGFTQNVAPATLSLAAGATGSATLTLTSPASASPAALTFTASATSTASTLAGSAQGTYTVVAATGLGPIAFNVLGVDAGTVVNTAGNGAQLFVSIDPNGTDSQTLAGTSLDVSSGGALTVTDADATAGTDLTAAFQLPTAAGAQSYDVFINALSTTSFAPCATNPASGEFLCKVGKVVVVPVSGKANVAGQLLQVDVSFQAGAPLFTFNTFGIFWQFNADNVREAKLRLFPAGTAPF